MPLRLVKMREAIAKIDASKTLREEGEEEKMLKAFVWSNCSYLESTEKESKNGKVWYCSLEDKFSNDAVPFKCQACDKYRMHRRSVAPQW